MRPRGAGRGRPLTPSPGKNGSKRQILTEVHGQPLGVAVSGASTQEMNALKPVVHVVPDVRSPRGPRRRKPAKLHADKGYDYDDLRRWLRNRDIVPRIARTGLESSTRLGRYRWRVERSFSWLFNYRRLVLRWERKATNFAGFLTLAQP